jgi:trk system potassium uptake protein TrkA
MNVVILGAGTVGKSIAELLCHHNINVTVVDRDPAKTQAINEELDVRVITGNAAESAVLFQTGISTADVALAVTGIDETNIVAASLAKAMGAKKAIARVYAPVFRDLSTFDYQKHFGIDRMLSLEHLAAMELARGIRDPSTIVIEQFAHGELEVLEFVVTEKCRVIHKPLRDLNLPANVLIGTISRGKRMWIASADDKIEIDDQVVVFCRRDNDQVTRDMFKQRKPASRRIVIAGGGETGFHLAKTLEDESYSVTLMELDAERSQYLANALDSTVVVHCNATHREVLEEERVGKADVFVACLGDDENNIVACFEAREIGTKEVMAIIGRSDYSKIVSKLGINLAVSEREVMAKQVFQFLTEGVVSSALRLLGGSINVLEIEVPADAPATQSTLAELGTPDRCLVAAIINNDDFVRVPHGEDRITAGEKVILLVDDDVKHAAVSLFEKPK